MNDSIIITLIICGTIIAIYIIDYLKKKKQRLEAEMDYKEYYEIYYNYKKAKNDLHKLENKIADVISSLISTTSKMRDDVNKGSNSNDKMLQLTAKKIELESQLKLAKDLLKIRTEQKNNAEMELRKSKDLKDIIYIKYFIDHIRPIDIAKDLEFARSYIYNLLAEIKAYIYSQDKKHKKKQISGQKT